MIPVAVFVVAVLLAWKPIFTDRHWWLLWPSALLAVFGLVITSVN